MRKWNVRHFHWQRLGASGLLISHNIIRSGGLRLESGFGQQLVWQATLSGSSWTRQELEVAEGTTLEPASLFACALATRNLHRNWTNLIAFSAQNSFS